MRMTLCVELIIGELELLLRNQPICTITYTRRISSVAVSVLWGQSGATSIAKQDAEVS